MLFRSDPMDDAAFSSTSSGPHDANATAAATTDSSSGGDAAHGEDFATMAHIAIQSLRVLVKNAKDDVKKVIEMVVPVLQPLFDAGDVAWRRIRSLFDRARELYRVYKNTNSEGGEGETCEESSYSDDEALSY